MTAHIAEDKGRRVKVMMRVRPMSDGERGNTNVICVDEANCLVSVVNPLRPEDVRTFKFDAVFGETTNTQQIFENHISAIVDSCLNGINSTVLVYGQTGTGKTFTMEGSKQIELRGLYYLILEYIMSKKDGDSGLKDVFVSFVELYKEEINDLLLDGRSNQSLELKGDGKDWTVHGLRSIILEKVDKIAREIESAQKRRVQGFTKLNKRSSRSHSILIIEIISQKTRSRLYLIDLAGSERLSKSGSIGEALSEATKINLSLSALTNVILALTTKRAHVPYRDSKLTRLLKDSLGGTAEVALIATCGPASSNFDESVQTLQYAQRCMGVTNHLRVNGLDEQKTTNSHFGQINKIKSELLVKSDSSECSSETIGRTKYSSIVSTSSSFGCMQLSESDKPEKDKQKQLQAMERSYKRLQEDIVRISEKAMHSINESKRSLENVQKELSFYEAVIENFVPIKEVEEIKTKLANKSMEIGEIKRPKLWDFNANYETDVCGKWQFHENDVLWIPDEDAILKLLEKGECCANEEDDEF